MKIEGIKKSYGKKQVLKNISFEANPGECIGILGINGCGKSTLLGILAGVVKSDGGRFLADGENLMAKKELRAQKVGYVPQSTPLIEELTAKDNLRLWYSKADMQKQLQGGVLSALGIDGFLKTPVHKMSGGMKKRLSIGVGVANNPEILLLDEPGAALDIVCKETVARYLMNFKSGGGIIVIATHDAGDLDLCDRLYVLKDGNLTPYEFDDDVGKLAGWL